MSDKFYDFPFYKWEKEKANDPFLRQPFGDNWEEYTWGEVGIMARKLAAAIEGYNLPEKSHIPSHPTVRRFDREDLARLAHATRAHLVRGVVVERHARLWRASRHGGVPALQRATILHGVLEQAPWQSEPSHTSDIAL